ncbi:hypothetical protein AVEN_33173-1 [Araneus ventricosus]|uniref:Uncharacterized protein n=1 Tax=Araneus ventricosus TaxID=182803 RepID=A0A4Y2VFT1_ARAVE|nr:hypothetical protein AVEN_33173-1 [Araneus ventricosus]
MLIPASSIIERSCQHRKLLAFSTQCIEEGKSVGFTLRILIQGDITKGNSQKIITASHPLNAEVAPSEPGAATQYIPAARHPCISPATAGCGLSSPSPPIPPVILHSAVTGVTLQEKKMTVLTSSKMQHCLQAGRV